MALFRRQKQVDKRVEVTPEVYGNTFEDKNGPIIESDDYDAQIKRIELQRAKAQEEKLQAAKPIAQPVAKPVEEVEEMQPRIIYKARAVPVEDMFNILNDRLEMLETQVLKMHEWASRLTEYLDKELED